MGKDWMKRAAPVEDAAPAKANWMSRALPVEEEKMGAGEAALTSGLRASQLGTTPFWAGLGGGIGQAAAEVTNPLAEGKGLLERLKGTGEAFKTGFGEARQESIEEGQKAFRDQPGAALAGSVAGGLLTGKFLPVGSFGQALKTGAIAGTGEAIGSADSLGEAAGKVATGAGIGGLGYGVAKLVGKGIEKVVPKAAKKIASEATGLSQKEIEVYATRGPEVKKIIQKYGDNIQGAADELREKFTQRIQSTKAEVYNQIKDVLKNPERANQTVDLSKMVSKFQNKLDSISQTQKTLKAPEVQELREIIEMVNSVAADPTKVPLSVAHEIKQFLQDTAKSSYLKGGQIFTRGGLAKSTAKEGAAIARGLIDDAAPELAAANKVLYQLHRAEENTAKNLLAAGSPEAGLLAAGRGLNPRNVQALKRLSGIVGEDFLTQAENLAAARTFGQAGLLPADTTGKTLTRMAAGGLFGTIMGGPVGGAIGTAMTSPAALKAAIDAGRFGSNVVEKLGGKKAVEMLLKTPQGFSAVQQALQRMAASKQQGEQ